MAVRPVTLVVVGTPDTTAMVVDLLRTVPGVVFLIGELTKEEQLSVEAVLNYCLYAYHTKKDKLAAAKVLCAHIYFLRDSLTSQEERVLMGDAEAKQTRDETQQWREETRAMRRDMRGIAAAPSYARCWKKKAKVAQWI